MQRQLGADSLRIAVLAAPAALRPIPRQRIMLADNGFIIDALQSPAWTRSSKLIEASARSLELGHGFHGFEHPIGSIAVY